MGGDDRRLGFRETEDEDANSVSVFVRKSLDDLLSGILANGLKLMPSAKFGAENALIPVWDNASRKALVEGIAYNLH